jgi:ferric-dicitrate binding protein FerR (iron transport regulator)
MMLKVLGAALALVVMLSIGAWAGEIEGKIQSVNADERMVVLEDGTRLSVAEGLSMDSLKEGAKVKASYEERDGKNVTTSFEVSE